MTKRLPTILFLLALFIGACSNTKYLPKNEKLYIAGRVNIVDKNVKKKEAKAIKTELEGLLRPKPNFSVLGLRPKLYIYNITRTTKTKGFKHWLNTKFGEPPVLFSAVNMDNNASILQNTLQNEGFFWAQVTPDSLIKNKTAKAIYNTKTGPVYKIRNVIFPKDTASLDTAVAGTAAKSFLRPGDNYSLDKIKAERLRIDTRLKELGFYYFAPEDILVQVDSTNAGKYMVDEYVIVKPETPDKAWDIYTLNKTYIYPNYTLRDTSAKLDSAVLYRDYYVVDPKNSIHPYVFSNVVALHPGEAYNRTDHNQALSRFIDLGPFKYVKNRFDISSTDSLKLNAFYYLTPYPKKSLRFEVLGRTTSASYTGSQVTLSWRNRNAFKGAELLTVSLLSSADIQASGNHNGYNVYQAGVQTSLTWPRFITPFRVNTNTDFLPRTKLEFEYDLTNRTKLYTLNSFRTSFGYLWRQDIHIQHQLNILNITYVNAASITKQYTDSIMHTHNPALQHVIDNQLTFGPTYSYTYTNTTEDYKQNTYYFNAKTGLSGNILGLLTGADTLAGRVKKILNINYSQYVKMESELRYYHKTGPNNKVTTRLIAGIGLPYGNSTIMPYSQQFFIGGANSLRGFRARSVGPGSYYPDQSITNGSGFLPDESGDIKIEGNIEYRPKLFSIVYGALFVDVGNVWLLNKNGGQPGGAFSKQFLSQMAADAGFGLRFDVSVLVLRTDLGFPIRKPWLPEGQRWVINKINFANGGWRSDNLVFNLAIGYPF